jgi:hypothetical protein
LSPPLVLQAQPPDLSQASPVNGSSRFSSEGASSTTPPLTTTTSPETRVGRLASRSPLPRAARRGGSHLPGKGRTAAHRRPPSGPTCLYCRGSCSGWREGTPPNSAAGTPGRLGQGLEVETPQRLCPAGGWKTLRDRALGKPPPGPTTATCCLASARDPHLGLELAHPAGVCVLGPVGSRPAAALYLSAPPPSALLPPRSCQSNGHEKREPPSSQAFRPRSHAVAPERTTMAGRGGRECFGSCSPRTLVRLSPRNLRKSRKNLVAAGAGRRQCRDGEGGQSCSSRLRVPPRLVDVPEAESGRHLQLAARCLPPP